MRARRASCRVFARGWADRPADKIIATARVVRMGLMIAGPISCRIDTLESLPQAIENTSGWSRFSSPLVARRAGATGREACPTFGHTYPARRGKKTLRRPGAWLTGVCRASGHAVEPFPVPHNRLSGGIQGQWTETAEALNR